MSLVVFISLHESALAKAGDKSEEIKLHRVEGQAKIGSRTLKTGDVVKSGDLIEVSGDDDALVDVRFPEGNIVRLKEGSKVRLQPTAGKTRVVLLLKGQVLAIARKPVGRKDRSFEIRTRTAVAGVRGTKFLVDVDEKENTFVCVCEGKVETQKTTGGPIRTLAAGDNIEVSEDKPIGTPTNDPSKPPMMASEYESMSK